MAPTHQFIRAARSVVLAVVLAVVAELPASYRTACDTVGWLAVGAVLYLAPYLGATIVRIF